MRFPNQTAPVRRRHGVHAGPMRAGAIDASGCNIFKAAGCVAALAACAAVCVGSVGTACVSCLGALGAGSCVECL